MQLTIFWRVGEPGEQEDGEEEEGGPEDHQTNAEGVAGAGRNAGNKWFLLIDCKFYWLIASINLGTSAHAPNTQGTPGHCRYWGQNSLNNSLK